MTITLKEENGHLIAAGPYEDMKEVYPKLKSRGWRYDGLSRVWYTPLSELTPAKRKNIEKILAPYMGQAPNVSAPPAPRPKTRAELQEEELTRRIRGGLFVVTPYEMRDTMSNLGGLWDARQKVWYLPDLETKNKAKEALKVYEEKAQARRVVEQFEQRKLEEARLQARAAQYPYQYQVEGRGKGDGPAIGHVFRSKKNGKVWTVAKVESSYFPEDGLSFGLSDDSGWMFYVLCREATESEEADQVLKETSHKRSGEAREARKNLVKRMRVTSNYHSGNHRLSGEPMVMENKRLLLHGGGNWFVIESGKIWYVENNGSDGADWSHNNVMTGGAGAMGWDVPHEPLLEAEILGLHEVLGNN